MPKILSSALQKTKDVINNLSMNLNPKNWAAMASSTGPISPADLKKNPKKYQDELKKAKTERLRKKMKPLGGGSGKSW